jgi:hypothetical protein
VPASCFGAAGLARCSRSGIPADGRHGRGKSSMNAMHNNMALALGVLLITTGSQSRASGQDTTYVCSSEIEAGMIYDSSLKEWRGARLKQKQKFVLKLKFVRAQQNGPEQIDVYNVSIRPDGDDLPTALTNCFAEKYGQPGDPLEVQAYAAYGSLTCSTLFRTYKFNMKNNRFLSAYIEGYVDGDTNDNTPAFAAGRCTKIN